MKNAFVRNLGWLTEVEQEAIGRVRVGILGAGGVGGQYAEILARLGVQHFVLWDPDTFAVENTNRQNGCQTSNYGRLKVDVIKERICDINPDAEVSAYPQAMTTDMVNSFCDAIDFYFDGLDFFEIEVRLAVFRQLRKIGVPAVTAAPVGTGAGCVLFTQNSMSFDDYFGMHTTKDEMTRSVLFITGVTPSLMQRTYVAEQSRINLNRKAAPSLSVGVYSCASLASATFLKVVLKRGPLRPAPWNFHYDPYLMKSRHRYVWLGHRNPLQRIKRWFAMRLLSRS